MREICKYDESYALVSCRLIDSSIHVKILCIGLSDVQNCV